MEQMKLTICFEDMELDEKNRAAKNLVNHLELDDLDAKISISREEPNNMDTGSIVGIILGSSSIGLLAGGIADWIRQKNQTSLIIELGSKRLELKNVRPEDVKAIIEAFLNGN